MVAVSETAIEPIAPTPHPSTPDPDRERIDVPTEVVPDRPLIVLQLSTPATYILMLINIALFALMVAKTGTQTLTAPSSTTLLNWGANFGPLTATGQVWRMFTAMFLHIGALHIFVNMYSLWILGRVAERFYGTARFLIVYVLSGLAGSCLSLLHNPVIVSAGASGAIFGMLGALLAFATLQKMSGGDARYHRIQISVLKNIALNIVIGLSVSGIDNSAHIGGLIFGTLAGAVFAPIRIPGIGLNQRGRAVLGGIVLLAVLGVSGQIAITRAQASPAVRQSIGSMDYRAYYDQIRSVDEDQNRIESELRTVLGSAAPVITADSARDLAQRAEAGVKSLQAVKLPNSDFARMHQLESQQAANLAAAAHAMEDYAATHDAAALKKGRDELTKSVTLQKDLNAAIQAYGDEYGIKFRTQSSEKSDENADDSEKP